MAYSQADIDEVQRILASGASSITYTSGSVTYRSLDDLRRLLVDMQRDVNSTATRTRTVGRFESGF